MSLSDPRVNLLTALPSAEAGSEAPGGGMEGEETGREGGSGTGAIGAMAEVAAMGTEWSRVSVHVVSIAG